MTLLISRTLAVALAALAPLPANALQDGSPSLASRAKRAGDDISARLEGLRAETGATGLVAIAVQDGQTVAWGAAGVRSVASAAPVTIDDPFHLGSCSKAITSTMIASLIEEEALRWETTVAEALPELAKEIDAGFHPVTIEHLLCHRGGIAERKRPEVMAIYEKFAGLEGTPAEQRRSVAKLAMEKPPLTKPGAAMDYSNYGYMTAAAMAERITGEAWEELVVERVFRPFGLTTAIVGSPIGDDVPVGHEREGEEWRALDPGPGGRLHPSMAPAGLVSMTLDDWARFVAAHLAGQRGEEGHLESGTYRRMHQVEGGAGYACGWGIGKYVWSWGEGTSYAHTGSDGTWFSVVFAVPEYDLIILTAANCGDPGGSASTARARDLMLGVVGFDQ